MTITKSLDLELFLIFLLSLLQEKFRPFFKPKS